MTAARKAAPPGAETAALFDLLGRARRALAHHDAAEVERLLPLLAALDGAPGAAPGRAPQGGRRALLGLFDEAGQLGEQIRQEQARRAAQLRAAGVHRQAGVAYRRAGKL